MSFAIKKLNMTLILINFIGYIWIQVNQTKESRYTSSHCVRNDGSSVDSIPGLDSTFKGA